MISVRYFLHSKESQSGTRSLYMDVHCDGVKRIQQAVGESLKKNQWSQSGQRVTTKHDYSKEINARLERLALKVQQVFREMMDEGTVPTGVDLRLILRPLRTEKLLGSGPVPVRETYEAWKAEYLRRKNRGVDLEKVKETKLQGYNYARIYTQVVTAIETFKPGATVKDLNGTNWDAYLTFLHEEMDVEDTTVSTHIKGWKVLREHAGLPTNEPWLKNTYNRAKLLPDLTWKEVLQLKNHKYEDMALQEVAHAFVIDCQLALRWGDFSTLGPQHLHTVNTSFGEVLCVRKRMGKTGGIVMVPMPPMARELFEQYGRVPVPKSKKGGVPHLQEYNKLIKKAAKEAKLTRLVTVEEFKAGKVVEKQLPLHEVLSSHTARHTAASRIRESGGYELAQLLLGHATQGNTARYAHLDTVKTAEKILQAWEYYK